MSSVRTTARCLSAVQVVMTSAPRTASAALVAMYTSNPRGSTLRTNLAIASGSTSHTRKDEMPSAARKPSAWNSDWEPVPIIAMTRESGRAR